MLDELTREVFMRKMLIVLSLVLLLPCVLAAQEEQEWIAIYGHTYFTPPEMVGTVTTVVAFLEPPAGFSYPFSVDFGAYEYTFYFQSTITSVVPDMFTTEITYADAEFYIYEDPSENGDYGVNPPNATSPSTFQDGTLILQGTFFNILRSDDNFGFVEPTIVADCVFTGGTKFGELIQGGDWVMHGGLSTDPFSTNIPTGYQQAWITKIFYTGDPVSVQSSTWGCIKSLFR
jgi:hypothetical protein